MLPVVVPIGLSYILTTTRDMECLGVSTFSVLTSGLKANYLQFLQLQEESIMKRHDTTTNVAQFAVKLLGRRCCPTSSPGWPGTCCPHIGAAVPAVVEAKKIASSWKF